MKNNGKRNLDPRICNLEVANQIHPSHVPKSPFIPFSSLQSISLFPAKLYDPHILPQLSTPNLSHNIITTNGRRRLLLCRLRRPNLLGHRHKAAAEPHHRIIPRPPCTPGREVKPVGSRGKAPEIGGGEGGVEPISSYKPEHWAVVVLRKVCFLQFPKGECEQASARAKWADPF